MQKQPEWQQRDLDAAHAALAVLDVDGNIVLINNHCCSFIGAAHSQLIGKNWFALHPTQVRHSETALVFRRVMSGEYGLLQQFESPSETISAGNRTITWRL